MLDIKRVSTIYSQPGEWGDPVQLLQLRCIELHNYSVGGGLTDPAHRDNGSVLTMSVQLSHPHEMHGGRFVTYSDGLPIVHCLARGDALLFHSEKLHNVGTVTRGLRCSLVVELWRQPTNVSDRFK